MSDRVTMADVAREVAVSLMTVSRVANNKRAVSPATRGRVQAATWHLNYQPSGVARNLAPRRTRVSGLVVSGLANPFFATVVRGVDRQAYAHGYNVLLANSDENSRSELSALSSLEEEVVQASAPGTLHPDLGHGSDASVHRQTKEVRLDREIDPAPT